MFLSINQINNAMLSVGEVSENSHLCDEFLGNLTDTMSERALSCNMISGKMRHMGFTGKPKININWMSFSRIMRTFVPSN